MKDKSGKKAEAGRVSCSIEWERQQWRDGRRWRRSSLSESQTRAEKVGRQRHVREAREWLSLSTTCPSISGQDPKGGFCQR